VERRMLGTTNFSASPLPGKIFYDEDDETLTQVAQRGSRCPIAGNIQG